MRVWLFFHLIGAAIWVGGLITMGGLVPAMRRAGVTRDQLRATARRFGRISWAGLGVSVVSGVALFWPIRAALERDTTFVTKLVLVLLTGGLAFYHTRTRRDDPRLRGILQGLILILSLGILAAAAAL